MTQPAWPKIVYRILGCLTAINNNIGFISYCTLWWYTIEFKHRTQQSTAGSTSVKYVMKLRPFSQRRIHEYTSTSTAAVYSLHRRFDRHRLGRHTTTTTQLRSWSCAGLGHALDRTASVHDTERNSPKKVGKKKKKCVPHSTILPTNMETHYYGKRGL